MVRIESPGNNNSNYHSKEYDQLYDAAAKLPPGPERTAVYKKMRDLFVNDMPWIPDANRIRYQLVHGWVKNFKPHLTILNSFKFIRPDMEKMKELKAKL